MKIYKKYVALIFTALLLILCFCSCNTQPSSDNKSTQVATQTATSENVKYVGSKVLNYDKEVYENIDEIIKDTEVVVLAHFVDTPRVLTEHFDYETTLYCTVFNMVVDEVIRGEYNQSSIPVKQTGLPDSDEMETKVKANQQYVLFLNKEQYDENTTVYEPSGIEQGVVMVNNDGTLCSYSDEGFMPQYDGKTLETLKNNIASIK